MYLYMPQITLVFLLSTSQTILYAVTSLAILPTREIVMRLELQELTVQYSQCLIDIGTLVNHLFRVSCMSRSVSRRNKLMYTTQNL